MDSQTSTNISAVDNQNPLVSFIVPCYNSADYMARCIDSLLTASQPCEILLINDGSSDETSAIAHSYASKDPRVRAIDQKNANWGGVVNTGLREARGIYFKVVDSDDFMDTKALSEVLDTLAATVEANEAPDLLITNYVYDRITDKTQHTIHYRSLFPSGKVFRWADMGKPTIDSFIMVHASWYKTAILHQSGLQLPEGISYMDSEFVLHPLPYVKTLLYLDLDTYHYIIGRDGQSVEVDVVKRQIDQQLKASYMAIDDYDYETLLEQEPNMAMLMMGYVICMMSVSTIYLFKINTPEALEKNRKLWDHMAATNPTLFNRVKHSMAGWANRKTPPGRWLAKQVYGICQKIFKFA